MLLKKFHFLITLRKWLLSKSLQQQRGLIWVLFSRHTLERNFECSAGGLSLLVFISRTWCSSEVISVKDGERKGISERTGVILCALIQSLHSQFHGGKCGTMWVAAHFKCSAAGAPRALTDCLLHFRTHRWWVSDPLNKKSEHHMVILKSAIWRYRDFMKSILKSLCYTGSVHSTVFVVRNHLPASILSQKYSHRLIEV